MSASADRLREAARVLRERATTEAVLRKGDPYYVTEGSTFERIMTPDVGLALADWLDGEAKHAELLGLQSAALNFLISTSDGTEHDPRWRVSLGYNTISQALAVADAILGGKP